MLDGGDDAGVSAAATDVAVQGFANGRVVRIRVASQQGEHRQDHAGRAVTALGGADLDERLLHRVQCAGAREGLYGRDLMTLRIADSTPTGVFRLTINQHRARSTRPLTAARLGARKTQFASKCRQQRHRRRQGPGNTVDQYGYFLGPGLRTIVAIHNRMLTPCASGICPS